MQHDSTKKIIIVVLTNQVINFIWQTLSLPLLFLDLPMEKYLHNFYSNVLQASWCSSSCVWDLLVMKQVSLQLEPGNSHRLSGDKNHENNNYSFSCYDYEYYYYYFYHHYNYYHYLYCYEWIIIINGNNKWVIIKGVSLYFLHIILYTT